MGCGKFHWWWDFLPSIQWDASNSLSRDFPRTPYNWLEEVAWAGLLPHQTVKSGSWSGPTGSWSRTAQRTRAVVQNLVIWDMFLYHTYFWKPFIGSDIEFYAERLYWCSYNKETLSPWKYGSISYDYFCNYLYLLNNYNSKTFIFLRIEP